MILRLRLKRKTHPAFRVLNAFYFQTDFNLRFKRKRDVRLTCKRVWCILHRTLSIQWLCPITSHIIMSWSAVVVCTHNTGCVPVPGDCLAGPGSAGVGIPNVYQLLTGVTGLAPALPTRPRIRWVGISNENRSVPDFSGCPLVPDGVLRGPGVRRFGNSNSGRFGLAPPKDPNRFIEPDPAHLSLFRRLPWWLAFPPTSG